jgi:hypothetical protein
MNETKALERALNVVLGNNVLSESYGGVFRQAAAELARLRADLDEAIRVIEMQKNSLIIWKSVYREAWTENDQERIGIASTFLEAHKETK